jgi:Protein of unknown function (DUF1524)
MPPSHRLGSLRIMRTVPATTRGILLATLVVVLGASVIAGTADARPPAPPGEKASRSALAKLKIAPRKSLAGYSRSRFGSRWSSAGDGCDTRDRVLQRDGRNVHTAGDCRITGTWTSLYDGAVITVGRELDIDHVVPLAHAWRTGAKKWTKARRRAFANDLTEPQLIAVSAHSNRSKGDSPPDEWKPPRRAVWCLYARWWIDVKTAWQLTTTRPERTSLRVMLRRC